MSLPRASSSQQLFLPDHSATISSWEWYLNIPTELREGHFSSDEIKLLVDYYTSAGLMRTCRWRFFREHFSRTFDKAATFLLRNMASPQILDLGCGTGTQALFFALRGARIVALDKDPSALALLDKRKRFYEQFANRELKIQSFCSASETFDYAQVAPIDGIYSMFAFNMMQPSARLLDTLVSHLSSDARIAIIDGNHQAAWLRLMGRRRPEVWTPTQFRFELERRGFVISDHRGAISLPPMLWALLPASWISWLNRLLNRTWWAPVSHQILAKRTFREKSKM